MIVLVTGGASCGKSKIAENIACNLGNNLFYIATMHQNDKESMERVIKHREMRKSKGFVTIEKQVSIDEINISFNSVCLIECISNLLANEMYDKNKTGDKAYKKIIKNIELLSQKVTNLVIVSNEIFSDGARYDSFSCEYINNLGKINTFLAEISDVFIEVVVGIKVYRKGSFYESF